MPAPRTVERALARAGDLVEAPVVFAQGAHLPLAGLWLILPALAATGLVSAFQTTYGRLRNGFYGLRATLLMLLFLALLRDPRAEGATRIRPADLGRLLGLDRAPEVKTLRRKLAELASHHRGAAVQARLAKAHADSRSEALGFLHVDGHTRVYSGTETYPRPISRGCTWPGTPAPKPGSPTPTPTRFSWSPRSRGRAWPASWCDCYPISGPCSARTGEPP
jgi:hypothetical protein